MEPMIAEGGFARRLRDALEPRLADLGDAVVARVPNARWHVEFPNSRVYDFDALLVFTPMSDRTAEVVVVSVTLVARRTSCGRSTPWIASRLH